MQYLFLNGRAIRDRALQHALGEAYRGLLLTGRQPICFLRLDMPAELVDVNVHPTKQEVRFQDSGRLYSQLLGTLRTKFLTTDLTARGSASASACAADDADEDGCGVAAQRTGAVGEGATWASRSASRRIAVAAADRCGSERGIALRDQRAEPLAAASVRCAGVQAVRYWRDRWPASVD